MKHNWFQRRPSRAQRRRGAATVELSLTAPFLLLMLAGAADFARVYYYAQTLASCAWNGACVAADPDIADRLPYGSVEETTLAGATGMEPPPTVEVNYGSDKLHLERKNDHSELRVVEERT